jgi:hypothetical protein
MALNQAQLMEAPGGPGAIGAVKTGPGIQITPDGTISIDPTNQLTQLSASTGVTVSPVSGFGEVTISTDPATVVRKILAGSNISLTPTSGVGSVTISALFSEEVEAGEDFPAGTRMVFYQATTPTGWTQVTDAGLSDSALRLVTASGGSTGNSSPFTTAFSAYLPTGSVSGTVSSSASASNFTPQGSVSISGITISGTTGGTTLSVGQLASHNHTLQIAGPGNSGPNRVAGTSNAYAVNAAGGNQAHSHSFSGNSSGSGSFSGQSTPVDVSVNSTFSGSFSGNSTNQFVVKYVDFLVAQKS